MAQSCWLCSGVRTPSSTYAVKPRTETSIRTTYYWTGCDTSRDIYERVPGNGFCRTSKQRCAVIG